MKFSEMTYTRPDIDALLARCKQLAVKAADAPDGDALIQVSYEQSRAFADYTTASQLANIHYTCDTRDAYWKAEQDFFDANGPAVTNASVEISRAFLANPYVEALTEHFGTTCVAGMKNAVLGMDDRTVELQQQFNAELKSLIQTSRGVISMGITPGRGHTILPHVLPAFREYFPDYEIQVHEENVDTLEQYLMNGTIEVAFFTVLEKSRLAQKCYTCELLSREELVICTPRKGNYELLAKAVSGRRYPWIDLKDLENDCFLTLKKNMRLGQFSAAILEKYQIEPRVVELSTIDTALALVARQYGVAFASGYRINEHEYANEISVFSFGDQPELWDFVAAYKNDTPLKQPVRQLIRLVSEFS